MAMFDLGGRVAVVTGATKGIGLGIARGFAQQGAKVVVSSRNRADCEAVANALNREYGKGECIAQGLEFDLGDRDGIQAFAADAAAAFGGVDILVCNAAVLWYTGPSAQTPPDLFDRILTVNIQNNFRLCQAMRPFITARGGGAVTLIGSGTAHSSSPLVMAYAVAKAGISHMALCLAEEFAPDGIRVNCVAPGLIRTPAAAATVGEAGFDYAAQIAPTGRIGEPEDIAGMVVFLSSDAGGHVTGETLLVDGGAARLSSGGQTRELSVVASERGFIPS
ncbi:MAG: SDR family oxidoreductase [Novosphingobium sp.]|nr:SDR family oxidoreductase [Novosphingobium sp.]